MDGKGQKLERASYVRETGDGGKYEVVTFPECEFGQCVQPEFETVAFDTVDEARLWAASKGYFFGDPFAPGC